jgi:hypothetical protein
VQNNEGAILVSVQNNSKIPLYLQLKHNEKNIRKLLVALASDLLGKIRKDKHFFVLIHLE